MRAMTRADVPALVPLNNAHKVELSELNAARFEAMVDTSFLALCCDDHDAFMLTFAQDAAYDSPNFLWFKARYPRFVYVDRVVVAPAVRGQGIARKCYAALFEQASADGHDLIVCEVNSTPPNPASDGFHAALGFAEVGTAELDGQDKTVRYLALKIPTTA